MENTVQSLATGIRDNAEAIAELLLNKSHQQPAAPAIGGPAEWSMVDGQDGPAVRGFCTECDSQLYYAEIFVSDKLDAERVWMKRQAVEASVDEHNVVTHGAGDRR